MGISKARRQSIHLLMGSVSLGALAILGAPQANAQAAQPTTVSPAAQDSATNNSGGLEEIVVVSRKKEELLQTTPVSVTAITGQQIADEHITRLSDLTQMVPNVKITEVSGSSIAPLIFIRGIGQVSAAFYSEPPIGVYIDGVYLPRPTGNAFDLPDLDRVEVLRGPQGTLFGRNTTGGAVLLYTSRPTQEFGGQVSVGYGSENETAESLVLNTGELGDTGFRSKLTVQHRQRDGWVVFPGQARSSWGGAQDGTDVSFTVNGDLGDRLSIDNRISYNELTASVGVQTIAATPPYLAYYAKGPSFGGPPVIFSSKPQDLQYRDPILNGAPATFRSGLEALTAKYDLGDLLQIKSITAYGFIDTNKPDQLGGSYTLGLVTNPPAGGSAVQPVVQSVTPAEPGSQYQFSEELQASGQYGEFNYLGGLYFYREHTNENITTITTSLNPAGVGVLANRSVTYATAVNSYAGYFQGGYKPNYFDDRLEIAVGGRYTVDDKGLASQTLTNFVLGKPQYLQNTWRKPGWSVSLSYQWTPEVMTYFRAASGFRSGGYNASSTGSPPFSPETSTSYEVGVKSEWFDKHLRLNATVFHTDYDNLQVNQYNTITLTNMIVNAAQAVYDGIELEGAAVLPGGFQVDANFGYVDPRYEQYNNLGPNGTIVNAAGQAHFPFVSKVSGAFALQYKTLPTPIGVITARTEYTYRSSSSFAVLDSFSPLSAIHHSGIQRTLDAQLTLSDIPIPRNDVNLKVQLYGANLTDNRFLVQGTDFGTVMTGTFNRPRSFGANLTADF